MIKDEKRKRPYKPRRRTAEPKTAKLWMCMTPAEHLLIKQASDIAGIGMAEYVITPAVERAVRELARIEPTGLTPLSRVL